MAVLLMIFDHRSTAFHRFRSKLSVIVYPVQLLVDAPIKLVHLVVDGFISHRQLTAENAQLRVHELLLQSQLEKLLVLERENTQLRKLLRSSSRVSGRVLVAQLLAVDLDPAVQQLILDKGSRDKVYVGQPVLDAYGVMGQVIDVTPLGSRILVLTDKKSAIPVEDYRNGVRSIAQGMGSAGVLSLLNVPDTTDIRTGDLFVTSGFGLRFPVGYPVGMVIEVKHSPGSRFATIVLRPAAHIDRTQQVLLVWFNKNHLLKAVQRLQTNKNSG